MSETCGWFLHRLGEDAARTFGLALGEFPRLRLLPLTAEHHTAVLQKLERLRGHKLTYEGSGGGSEGGGALLRVP